jgi:hypothetical protein
MVVQEGAAGPYTLRVVVRPPGVIPGLVDVTVRATSAAPSTVTVRPALWRTGTKGAPAAELAIPVPGEPGTFSTQLWIMSAGSYAFHVAARGPDGEGTLIVPFTSAATATLGMPRGLGWVLVALGALLVVGFLSIVGAATREGTLDPGLSPDARRRTRARRATVIAGGAAALALFGGWRWWDAVEQGYRRSLYRSLRVESTVTPGAERRLTLAITDSLWRFTAPRNRPRASTNTPLMPDHGKIMHLFLVAERGEGAAAHLHPVRTDERTFTTSVPGLPAGRYWLFADVVHESGYLRTFTDTVDVPAGTATPNPDGDDAIATTVPDAATGATLADGGRITISVDGTLAPERDVVLRARVREADGTPAPIAPWLGMAGHAMLLRTDGGVFMHLHPMGTASMAAQERLARREAGDTALHGEAQPTTAPHEGHAGHAMPDAAPDVAATGEVAFPVAFPTAGRYRVFVQLRRQGRAIETAAIDVTVPPASTATR